MGVAPLEVVFEDFVLDESANDVSELLPEAIPGKGLYGFYFVLLDIPVGRVVHSIQQFNERLEFGGSLPHYLLGSARENLGDDQDQLLLNELSEVMDVLLGNLVDKLESLLINANKQGIGGQFVEGVFRDELGVAHRGVALDQDLNGLYLARSDVLVELGVLIVQLDVLFEAEPDLAQDRLVHLQVVLFVLLITLQDVVYCVLGDDLVLTLDLPQVAKTD